jgi:heme exporter protein A
MVSPQTGGLMVSDVPDLTVSAMIDVHGLVKSFGSRSVLKGIDLEVTQGESLVLVGPNGAGKSTLLRILATLSKPTAGSVRLAGFGLADAPNEMRQRVGFLSHQPLLYGELSGEENLRFYGRMYEVTELEQRISALLDRVGLTSRGRDLVRTYSRGMRQRLAIARTLLHDPPVLLLDEPYTGLDLPAARMLDALLREMGASSRTVLLTTHSLEQGLRRSRRAAILANGRIVYQMNEKDWDPDRFREEYERQTADDGWGR